MSRTQRAWRLANRSISLTIALFVGCGNTSEQFELLRVEPAVVSTSVATPAIVKGTQFYDFAKVSLNGNSPATIKRGWNAWVDARHLQSAQTARVDANSLSIVLPVGLPIGTHDVSVMDPRGLSRTLRHAFTVVADDTTTIANPVGGAPSSGSGGASSRSNGGTGSNSLASSGGTAAVGGVGSSVSSNTDSTSGGTDATGGIIGYGGSSGASSANGGTPIVGGTESTVGTNNATSTNGGAQAAGGVTGTAGTCTQNCSPACPNGTCDPGESPCSCPADCNPPSCGDAESPQLCDATDPSLVACYRFESSAQPGNDDSQYGNNATSKNVSLVSGRDGNSISLGSTSQVNVAKSPSLDVLSITIETWVYVAKTPSGTRAGLLDSEGQYGLFLLKSGVLWCSMTLAAGDSAAQTTAAVGLLEWTHVACTCDGVNVKIFINGVVQASSTATGKLATAGTTGLTIGADNPSGDNLVGLLDDLRIWNVAHTADQVCAAAHACTP